MNLKKLNARKEELQGGLERLEASLKQYLKAIEVQKGAIGEVDHWIEQIIKEDNKTTKKIEENSSEKSEVINN